MMHEFHARRWASLFAQYVPNDECPWSSFLSPYSSFKPNAA